MGEGSTPIPCVYFVQVSDSQDRSVPAQDIPHQAGHPGLHSGRVEEEEAEERGGQEVSQAPV